MKRILIVLLGASVMTACTYNAKDEAMAKQEIVKHVKDSLKLDSFRKAEVAQKAKLARIEEEKKVLLLSERNEAAATPGVVQTQSQAEQKKKGWSSAAKGAVIGAGAGALGGVLIDKKDGRGAIIGGVVGAGTGYLIGRDKDRKSGRVQPKN